MTQTATHNRTRVQDLVHEPPMFKVIYLNDDQTSMEFVIDSLQQYFGYTFESAEQTSINIHESGSAVVAVLPFELAEQKGIEVTLSARSQSYPLQVKLEPEGIS
jgi:ATP-dependent Clp protease adaptor protein ClpS